jgi:hypothetical protein
MRSEVFKLVLFNELIQQIVNCAGVYRLPIRLDKKPLRLTLPSIAVFFHFTIPLVPIFGKNIENERRKFNRPLTGFVFRRYFNYANTDLVLRSASYIDKSLFIVNITPRKPT